jgi:hypothetical protein
MVGGISRLGRLTQGVTVMRLNDGDAVAAFSVEGPQEDGANPNIMATAEAIGEPAANGNGRTNGRTNGRANGAKPKSA